MTLRRSLILVAALLYGSSIAIAQTNAAASPTPKPTATPPPTVTAVGVENAKCPVPEKPTNTICEAGIGDTIIVKVENLPPEIKTGGLTLFLEGRPLKGVTNSLVEGKLNFLLKRTSDSTDTWSILLAKPDFNPYRLETVSVGPADGQPFASADKDNPVKIKLRVYYRGWAIFCLILLVLTLILFVWLARTTGIIRDSNPPLLGARLRPYSLARTQAAVWFFLIIGSFIFICLITGDYNTITEQALILMGIGTGTALGSAMIDASKNDTANSQLSELKPQQVQLQSEITAVTANRDALSKKVTDAGTAATADDKQALNALNVKLNTKQAQLDELDKKISDASSGLSKPASEGFGRDLLTDVNGINFHRFQMLAWTIVLAFLFCAGVYTALAMPQFSGTLLALMGISSGTYLGFKIPEKQN
jgi:hypothetical protein